VAATKDLFILTSSQCCCGAGRLHSIQRKLGLRAVKLIFGSA
jgi:hypothetical protein